MVAGIEPNCVCRQRRAKVGKRRLHVNGRPCFMGIGSVWIVGICQLIFVEVHYDRYVRPAGAQAAKIRKAQHVRGKYHVGDWLIGVTSVAFVRKCNGRLPHAPFPSRGWLSQNLEFVSRMTNPGLEERLMAATMERVEGENFHRKEPCIEDQTRLCRISRSSFKVKCTSELRSISFSGEM